MKGGIVYANFVTAVSPHHAAEARYSDGGFGLAHALSVHHQKFGGVLNGVDSGVWNPEIDRYVPKTCSASDLGTKHESKERLRERFWLRKTWSPVVAFVGRLDDQKCGSPAVSGGRFPARRRLRSWCVMLCC